MAAEERRAELARYEAIVEAVDDLVFVIDDNGEFTFVNEAQDPVTGYDEAELVETDPSVNVPPADVEKTESIIADLLRSEERTSATYEMEVVAADGERVPCETHIALLTDDDGTYRGAAGIVRDVSDRKERQQRYSTVAEQATDGIYIARDGAFEFVNGRMASLLGASPAEIEGSPVLSFVAADDRATLAAAADRPSADRADDRFEVEFVTADGDRVPVEVRTTAVRYRGEAATLGIVRDVSERRKRERELELYETMLNAVPDPVYALDEEARFLAVNETAERLTGREAASVLGEHVSTVMTDDDLQRGAELVSRLVHDDRERGSYEMTVRTADGESVPVENHIGLLTDDDGRMEGSVGVLRDISDRVRRQQRLTVLNRALRHDLRNSMHVVLANAEVLEERADDPDAAEKLATIRRRAQSIASLSEKARVIEQTLADANGGPSTVDVAALVADEVDRFRSHDVDASFETALPEHAWVEGTDLLDVAVENLVENSLQHADGPTVEVSVAVADGTVSVRVADDGPGIPEKERRVVTQGTETPLDHASGLGLWLVAWITRDSGGRLVFEDDGPGSAVRLEFDRAAPPPDAADPVAPSGQGEHAE
ncbi:MAG: PAS domain S-box protein [Haloarculaceae archaeon]